MVRIWILDAIEGELSDSFDWNGFLVSYSKKDIAVVKIPEDDQDIDLSEEDNNVSLMNTSSIRETGDIIAVLESKQAEGDLKMINLMDVKDDMKEMVTSELYIGALSLDFSSAKVKDLLGKKLEFNVIFCGEIGNCYNHYYNLKFQKIGKTVKMEIVVLTIFVGLVFLVLTACSVKKIIQVKRLEREYQKRLDLYKSMQAGGADSDSNLGSQFDDITVFDKDDEVSDY